MFTTNTSNITTTINTSKKYHIFQMAIEKRKTNV